MLNKAVPRPLFASVSAALALSLLLVSGCAKAQAAKVAPEPPALDVPAPPPRVIIETVEVDAPPVPAPPDPRRPPVRRPEPAATGRGTRPEPRADTPRTDATPAEAVRPAEESARPPSLQTTPTGADVERSIRLTLNRAAADLNRVDYRALNTDARTQYDTAKRFAQQAEEAVRAKNLVFARNLADKAGALAAQLAGR